MSTFPAIIFTSEADCLTFQEVLSGRITHQLDWSPFKPTPLIDGHWAAEIADSIRCYLLPEEVALIQSIDGDQIYIPPRG